MAYTVGLAQSDWPTEGDNHEPEIIMNMTYTAVLATFSLDSINLFSPPPGKAIVQG